MDVVCINIHPAIATDRLLPGSAFHHASLHQPGIYIKHSCIHSTIISSHRRVLHMYTLHTRQPLNPFLSPTCDTTALQLQPPTNTTVWLHSNFASVLPNILAHYTCYAPPLVWGSVQLASCLLHTPLVSWPAACWPISLTAVQPTFAAGVVQHMHNLVRESFGLYCYTMW